MKLIDAIQETGNPFNISDCRRDELPEFFKEMGFQVGAEIGVYRGEFTEKFCKAGLRMYAIDPWTPYVGVGKSEQAQEMQDYNYNMAQKVLSKYTDCTILKKSSMEALKHFGPGSLDFVYIDGDHRFRYVAEDVAEWYQKVKSGGIVAGHDYYATAPTASNLICQVKPVIDAFVETYDIKNFYTFGRSEPTLEEKAKNDRNLSWMFIKK